MLTTSHAFSGFAVRDVNAAREFYGGVLGFSVEQNGMGILDIALPGGAHVIAYPKDDHVPAVFTILNFEVADIDAAVDELEAAGVSLENYGGWADERGIMRGKAADRGPDIAWFLDPSGNILSVLAN
ncbi:extradiol dioxygenase family protein [Frondihabitans sp. PhB188]|uniref:VOC family protein n=1 Tax=Frondihabitans sp. PhB188 TaxID=2485200 RepID=UPI000F4689B3|nr:VOC family protein [Frondihabitans sp. PhB188]ROQ40828.1 extradiol dioxygenase family protein [Frondihabitans sp. PhB188]